MISPFDEILCRKIERLLNLAEEHAYWSRYMECYVVRRECASCERLYEEEKEAAKAKMIRVEEGICLTCDPAAAETSITAVKMYGLWMKV